MGQDDLTQWAQPNYVDDDFTIASPIGIPVFESTIPSTTDEFVFTQEFMQFRSEFEPLPLNTPHDSEGEIPDYSDYVLVKEGPRKDVRGGIVQWTRTYAKPPDSYDDFESFNYNFIGFEGVWLSGSVGVVNPANVTGRPRKSRTVTVRLHRDFFIVGPGGTYQTSGDIPIFFAQDYIDGGVNPVSTEYLADAIGPFPATIPSLTTYKSWIANAASLKWKSGWTADGSPNPGQFLVEDSRLSRWLGNIWVREMRFALAQ